MDLANSRSRLYELLPGVDIRTDQCDTVRIYWRGRAAFLRNLENGFEVKIMLLAEKVAPGFAPDAFIVDCAYNESEATEKVAKWLHRVHDCGW